MSTSLYGVKCAWHDVIHAKTFRYSNSCTAVGCVGRVRGGSKEIFACMLFLVQNNIKKFPVSVSFHLKSCFVFIVFLIPKAKKGYLNSKQKKTIKIPNYNENLQS